MKIVKISDTEWIKIAQETLESGGIVLHPTDTSYGLAVDCLNSSAIEKVVDLKQRDGKALIIVVRDLQMAREYVEITSIAETLIAKMFPGALTLVLNKKPIDPDHNLPSELTAGRATVGIRIPDYQVTAQISAVFSRPYTSTSANLSGEPPAYSVEEALNQLDSTKIGLVIDAGKLPTRPTSTVVDATQESPQILREGPVTKDMILKALQHK